MNQLQRLEQTLCTGTAPHFEIGDTVRVHVKVIEGEKERVQVFEGVVIARKGRRMSETFTVRKISYGVGVERVFPVFSPTLAKIEVIRKGKVRRAKLYYLRTKKGKEAKVAEREFSKTGNTQATQPSMEEPKAAANDSAKSPEGEGA